MTEHKRKIVSAVNEAPLIYDKDKYLNHLIEQYEIYVEMTDRLSARRMVVNNFFTTLMSASAVAYTVGPNYFKDTGLDAPFQMGIALASCLFAILWRQTIVHYKELAAAKFAVIQDIELLLPAQAYTAEYMYFSRDQVANKNWLFGTLSEMEAVIASIAAIVSGLGFLLGIWRLLH